MEQVKYYFLMILFVGFFKANAQKIYRTEEGHIIMMTILNSLPIKAESHKLALYLDYNTKVVNGVLDLKSLSTDNLEINTMLTEEEEPLILRFTGTIPSEDFLSKRHDPISFNWLVTITYKGKSYQSSFKATLTHINQGLLFSCLLSASGDMSTLETGLERIIPGLGTVIEIQFAQLILRKE